MGIELTTIASMTVLCSETADTATLKPNRLKVFLSHQLLFEFKQLLISLAIHCKV